MADLSDVENALLAAVTQAVYPIGTGNPSVAGAPCKILRGWPVPANLDADLKAQKINISIFPLDTERKTTRYPREWQAAILPNTPSLTLTVAGTTITVGGTPSTPLNAAVLVNGKAYVYAVQASDTTTTIATALAALINADTPASSVGTAVTIPARTLAARVGGSGTILRETRRQKRTIMITFWCPTPALRDQIVPPVDAALTDIDFLALPDGTAARLIYEKSLVSDQVEREGLYRRDLMYSVEYGTTDTQAATQIVATPVNVG